MQTIAVVVSLSVLECEQELEPHRVKERDKSSRSTCNDIMTTLRQEFFEQSVMNWLFLMNAFSSATHISPPARLRIDMEDELELIRSSLLSSETLQPGETDSSQYTITSADSPYRIHFTSIKVGETPVFQLKSDDMGREEAVGWSQWVEEKRAESWEEALGTG